MIEDINSRKLKGTFTEIGCGMPVAGAILSCEGASNTVVLAQCPYAKEEQERLFGKDYPRSVSLEFVQKVIEVQRKNYPASRLHYVTSFQVGYDACSHGWIGIYTREEDGEEDTCFYHLTFNKGLTRLEMMTELGIAGLGIIRCGGFENFYPTNYTVDIEYPTFLPGSFISRIKDNPKGIILMNNGYGYKRLEDYLRDNPETLNVYKGSFNPFHDGHRDIASCCGPATLTEGKKRCLLVISMNTHEKGFFEAQALYNRANTLAENGYVVAIMTAPMFQDTIDLIRERGYKGKINMLMGRDTAVRLWDMKNYKEDETVSFTYFDRGLGGEIPGASKMFKFMPYHNPISSTEMRKKV